MKTSSIAILAALATFGVSPVFAQDQNSTTTGQQVQQPSATNPAVDPSASGTGSGDTSATTGGTAQTTPPAGDTTTGTAQTTPPAGDTTTGTAQTTPPVGDTSTGTAQTMTPSTTQGDDMATTAGAAGNETFITTQSTEQFLGSKLMGAKVRSAANEDIGDVNDVLFDMSGRGVGVVVGVGGFLGIGEKNVAIPFERLTITREEGDVDDLQVSLETTKDELNAAPDFRRAEDNNATAEGVTPSATDPNATGSTTGTDMDAGTDDGAATTTPPATNQ